MKQLVDKYLGRIEWLITALFFIIIPVVFYKKQLDPVLYSRYFALSIWILTISAILMVKSYNGKFFFYFSRVDKIFFASALMFVLVNVISSFNAINYSEAIYKTFKEFALITTVFYLYQMLRNNLWGKDLIIKSVILMTSIFIGIAIVQLFNADFTKFSEATSFYAYYFRMAIWDVKSTLANKNPFAYFLLLSLPFSIYGAIFYKKVWRIFSILIVLLTFAFIGILVSKGGWVATILFVAICLFLLYLYLFFLYSKETGKKLASWIKVSLIIAPIILLIAGLFVIKKTDIKVVKVVTEKFNQLINPEEALHYIYSIDKPTSAQTRTLVWANTIEMVRDNPLLGVGPGQWRIVYAKYGLDGFDYELRNGSKHFQRTHNDFLWIVSETGLIGFLFYLLMYGLVLVVAFKNMYAENDMKIRVLNMLIFSSLLAFVMVLFISFARERISHNLLYLLLMALVLVSKKNKEVKILQEKHKTILIGVGFIILILGSFNLKIAIDMVKGENAARLIRIGMKQKNYPLVQRAIRSIEGSYYTMDAFAVPIPFYQGTIYSTQNKVIEAKKEFIKAYKIHPYHLQVLNNLGTSYDLTDKTNRALDYYQDALNISPRYKEALVNMSIVYYNLDDFDESLKCLTKIPYSEVNPKKFNKAVIAVCRKGAIRLVNRADNEKLKLWFYDENKIKDTFVKYQNQGGKFDEILLEEIGN